MDQEALRIFRQIRTCLVILTVLATIWSAWWFLPRLYLLLRSSPGAFILVIALAVVVGFATWMALAAGEKPGPSQGS